MAMAAVVATGAALVSAQTTASLQQSQVSDPAYAYNIDPFHCDQPKVDVLVNASYTTITLTYYNEERADTLEMYPSDRTTFTYATWNSALAHQPLVWDPADPFTNYNPSLASAFTTGGPNGAAALSGDRYLYRGMCDPSKGRTSPYDTSAEWTTNEVSYNTVSNLTQTFQTSLQTLTAGLYTPTFYGLTAQTVGCKCISFAQDASGIIYPVADENAGVASYTCVTDGTGDYAENGDTTKLYWTADIADTVNYAGRSYFNSTFLTNGWAIRQTTCPAGGPSTLCDGYRFKPQVLTNSAKCGLRTEAKFVVETPALQDLPFVAHDDATGTNTWSLYTVEVGSTSNFTAGPWPMDSFASRVLEHKFQLTINPFGAIVIPVDAGDMLPPLISRVRSTSATRATDASTANIQFMLNMYVRQPNTLNDTNVASGVADPSLMLKLHELTMDEIAPQLVIAGSGWTGSCQTFNILAPDTNFATGSQIACTRPSCGLLRQTQLPSYITANFNPTTMNTNYYWLQYDVTVQCAVTSPTPVAASSALQVPSTTVNIDYAIADANRVITDSQVGSRPYVTFNTYFTLPALTSEDTNFPLIGRVVEIQESTIVDPVTGSKASSLSDIVYANENNDVAGKHRFAYSQAMAFKVQLQDMATRAQWQLRPTLALLAAFNDGGSSPSVGGEPDISSVFTSFSSSNQLQTTFCGLDRTDLAAAFVFKDGSGAGGIDGLTTPTVSGGVITNMGRFGNMDDGLSPALSARLATLITSNSFTDVSVFEGNIYTTNMTSDSSQGRVFNVPDATGGFAVPLRNRLRINGQIGTYSIKFCALVEVAPYNATVRNGWYPLYPTKAAALADSLAVDNVLTDPIVVYGSDFVSGSFSATSSPGASVKYYLPFYPISSGGTICVPAAKMGIDKLVAAGVRVKSAAVKECSDMISGTLGIYNGRRLQSTVGGRRSLMQAVQMNVESGIAKNLVTNYAATPPIVLFDALTPMDPPPTSTETPSPTDTPTSTETPSPTSTETVPSPAMPPASEPGPAPTPAPGPSPNWLSPGPSTSSTTSSTDTDSPSTPPAPSSDRAGTVSNTIPAQTPKEMPAFMIIVIVVIVLGGVFQIGTCVRTVLMRK